MHAVSNAVMYMYVRCMNAYPVRHELQFVSRQLALFIGRLQNVEMTCANEFH